MKQVKEKQVYCEKFKEELLKIRPDQYLINWVDVYHMFFNGFSVQDAVKLYISTVNNN